MLLSDGGAGFASFGGLGSGMTIDSPPPFTNTNYATNDLRSMSPQSPLTRASAKFDAFSLGSTVAGEKTGYIATAIAKKHQNNNTSNT